MAKTQNSAFDKKLLIEVTEDLHKRVRQFALDNDSTMRVIVTEAIETLLSKGKPAKKSKTASAKKSKPAVAKKSAKAKGKSAKAKGKPAKAKKAKSAETPAANVAETIEA